MTTNELLASAKGHMSAHTHEEAVAVAKKLAPLGVHGIVRDVWIISHTHTYPEMKKLLGNWNKADACLYGD